MTLIITELSEFGIAMIADSAVTCAERLPSGQSVRRVLNGALKLQMIPYFSAGVSVWGLGTLPTNSGQVATDIWLHDFIQQHSRVVSLHEFAQTLTTELQEIAGNIQEPLGLHLAGYVDVEGCKLPTFYHIRNNDGTFQGYKIHDFILGHEFPPQKIAEGDNGLRVRNGDYGTYAILSTGVESVLPQIRFDPALNIAIPFPSLQGRIAYLTAWVRFVSDLYASSGLLRTIGGGINSLGISPDGRVIYNLL